MLLVIKVLAQQGGEIRFLANGSAAGFVAVLVKDGGDSVFKDNVIDGISGGLFLLDFGEQIVAGVFGFPISVRELPKVLKRAVYADAAPRVFGAHGIFFVKLEIAAVGEPAQQGTESMAGAAFITDSLGAHITYGAIVLFEQSVVRLDGDLRHLLRFRRADAANHSTVNPEKFLLVYLDSIVIYLTNVKSG